MSQSIVLGGGCFWCLDAIYRLQTGVTAVTTGYAGGTTDKPTYEQICMGDTGHAEVVKVDFDGNQTSLKKLLELFWQAHDPTTPNQQGEDIGTQYRSIIFFSDDAQKKIVNESIADMAAPKWGSIATEIKPLKQFYPAEEYHQNYFTKNPEQPYCQVVIAPKIKKLVDGRL